MLMMVFVGESHTSMSSCKNWRIFPFGAKKIQSFTFTGIEITQLPNKTIILSQGKYISKVEPIHIKPERKENHDSEVTADERLGLRALIGSLQYAAVNTRPDLASRLSHLQSSINTATISILIEANKVLHNAKKHKKYTSKSNQFSSTRSVSLHFQTQTHHFHRRNNQIPILA